MIAESIAHYRVIKKLGAGEFGQLSESREGAEPLTLLLNQRHYVAVRIAYEQAFSETQSSIVDRDRTG